MFQLIMCVTVWRLCFGSLVSDNQIFNFSLKKKDINREFILYLWISWLFQGGESSVKDLKRIHWRGCKLQSSDCNHSSLTRSVGRPKAAFTSTWKHERPSDGVWFVSSGLLYKCSSARRAFSPVDKTASFHLMKTKLFIFSSNYTLMKT